MAVGYFSEVPQSIEPSALDQWFKYAVRIQVRNESTKSLTLTEQTTIRIGGGDAHAFAENLHAAATVLPGNTATLESQRTRICGRLPANEYNPELKLIGVDQDGTAFDQILSTTHNRVEVVAAPHDPVAAIGVASTWTFRMPVTATAAQLPVLIRTQEPYPDDVTVEWYDLSGKFDILFSDGSPFPGTHVYPDVEGSLDVGFLLRRLEDLTPEAEHVAGTVIARRNGARCPHTGGISPGVGSGGRIRVVPVEHANLELLCATSETREVQRGGTFHLNVGVRNPKNYHVYVAGNWQIEAQRAKLSVVWDACDFGDSLTAETLILKPQGSIIDSAGTPSLTSLRAVCNMSDVSDKFAIETIIGTRALDAQQTGIITFVVRVANDAPRDYCQLYPTIASYAYTHNEATTWYRVFGFVDGEITQPPVRGFVVPRD